jgi:hypothetical protein
VEPRVADFALEKRLVPDTRAGSPQKPGHTKSASESLLRWWPCTGLCLVPLPLREGAVLVNFLRLLRALFHHGHPPPRWLTGHRRVAAWAGRTAFSLCNSPCGVDSARAREVTVPDLYSRQLAL